MKIRIKGNSLRIRLTRSEVDDFGKNGYLEEKTEFAGSTFTYALAAKEGIATLEASYAQNKMIMYVPAHIPAAWAANEVVGYDHIMNPGNNELYLLLEKDFKCIDAPAHEDQSDNFDNPHEVC